jgi:hypothetical protein
MVDENGNELAPDDANRRNLEQLYRGVLGNFQNNQRARILDRVNDRQPE